MQRTWKELAGGERFGVQLIPKAGDFVLGNGSVAGRRGLVHCMEATSGIRSYVLTNSTRCRLEIYGKLPQVPKANNLNELRYVLIDLWATWAASFIFSSQRSIMYHRERTSSGETKGSVRGVSNSAEFPWKVLIEELVEGERDKLVQKRYFSILILPTR